MNIVFLIGQMQYLIIALAFKHFLADFVFQTDYMDRKTRYFGWVWPMIAHCSVHAILTFFVVSRYGVFLALWVAIVDGIAHFVIDTIKVRCFQIDPSKKSYWVVFGADQFLHYLTYIFLVRWVLADVMVQLSQIAVKVPASYFY